MTELQFLKSIHSLELERLNSGYYKKQLNKFWENVEKSKGCWLWKRPLTSFGYGQISMFGRRFWAHRVAFLITNFQIPNEMLVLHKCDNRACCNPDHLFLGTDKDNSDDKIKKGRDRKANQKGSSNGAARLNEKNVKVIKSILDEYSDSFIAKQYKVSRTTISAIRHNRNWSDVC